jgi:hypothetical protein
MIATARPDSSAWRGKSFAWMAPTLTPRDRFLIRDLRVRAAESGHAGGLHHPAERGLVRHHRGGLEHRPGYRPVDFTGATSIPERDAKTRRLNPLEEQ